MFLDLSLTSLTTVLLVSVLAGVAKVAFGIGAGVFLTPVLALVLPPKMAVALMLPVMFVTDILAIQHHWGKWSPKHALVLIPTCFVGVLIGSWFLASASSDMVARAIGVIALVFVALQFQRMRGAASKPSIPMPAWGGWIIGLIAGITTSIAHAGGIVMSIYLLTQSLPKNAFVATVVVAFFASNLLKAPLYWQIGILTMPIILTGLALTPIMLLGGRLGQSLNRRLTVEQFTRFVVVIVGLSGLLLLLNG